MRKTKGKKIDGTYIVARTGTALVGCMSWETPFVYFHRGDLESLMVWHSDAASEAIYGLQDGEEVNVKGFLYGDHLRRVTVVTAAGKIYGIQKR